MLKIVLNNSNLVVLSKESRVDEIYREVSSKTGLSTDDFYLIQNGRKITEETDNINDIHICLRVLGGKGGFGSMLRAIGAQIEKTTNREACRDLSGRRLRDINEEKRLKTWLEKQNTEPEDPEEKFQKKIGKLLAKPKHEFKDEVYETARSELTQTIDESVEKGFEKAKEIEKSQNSKRKMENDEKEKKKKMKTKKKGALWLGGDFSSSSDTDSDAGGPSTSKTEDSSNASEEKKISSK